MRKEFLVPDYYPDFACKCGACRSCCCYGWSIAVSMKEYFRLLGMDCSPELRRRLDGAFHLAEAPNEERYALVSPRWDGFCPLFDADGLCALQKEMGEAALASVCRLYPRSPKARWGLELSCSNSCERVAELLLAREKPLTFRREALDTETFEPEGAPDAREAEIRMRCIDAVQNRALPLPERLAELGRNLRAASGDEIAALPEEHAQPERALAVLGGMIASFERNNLSMRVYGEAVRARYALTDEEEPTGERLQAFAAAYARDRAHFEKTYPEWETAFEHLLVNHMFYEQFPFADRRERMGDEFAALCAVYALLRLLCVGYLAEKNAKSDFADVVAGAFRLIEHTSFYWNADVMLHRARFTSETALRALLCV